MKGATRRMVSRCAGATLLLVCITTGAAAPVVIYDSGRTAPLAPYLGAVQVRPAPPPAPAPPLQDVFGLPWRLPVRTTGLQPGRLAGRPAPEVTARLAYLPVPFFVLGADAFSVQWLVQHRARLQALGAVGLLVQAETAADLARVQQAAAGLPMVAAPGDSLAPALGLTVYPVLVSREGLSQ